jgi:hypothetical protein
LAGDDLFLNLFHQPDMPERQRIFVILEREIMRTDIDDLIDAADKTADTSFDASAPVDTFGANRIAARRSGSEVKGFYRPGERDKDGAPFEVLPTKCPLYNGPPSGRVPTNKEKRGAWQLQEEYLVGRLGKNDEENSRLWNTATWLDQIIRTATMPTEAVKSLNLCADGWKDAFSPEYKDPEADPDEKNEGFGVVRFKVDERDKKRLAIKLSDYDLASLAGYFKECDDSANIDRNKLVLKADPLPKRIDIPGPIERQHAIKIMRMLMVGMRSLWHPVKRAIVDHATMKSLGETQNVGDGVAAAVGRWRVIEGLRVAESIRKGIARSTERLAVDEAKHWPAKRRHMAFLDKFINEVLTTVAAMPLPANDNYRIDAVASNAA